MPTEGPARFRRRGRESGGEREEVERGKNVECRGRGVVSGMHAPCCRAMEMHGHALFSEACLGVFFHKGTWLVEHCCIHKEEPRELVGAP